MTGKGVLKGVFNVAATGFACAYTLQLALFTTAMVPVASRIDDAMYPAPSGDALTKEEIDFVQSIFGDEINLTRVRKHLTSKKNATSYAQTFGKKKIKFYGLKFLSSDYSQTNSLNNYNAFIHEMTHIWQNRNMLRRAYNSLRHPSRKYEYELSSESRFKDFGKEQQASIIGDYALQFLHPINEERRYILPYKPMIEGPLQDLALLQKVVETRFPQARITREALEAQKREVQKMRRQMFLNL